MIRDFTDVRDVVTWLPAAALQAGPASRVQSLGSGWGTKISDALEYLRSLARVPIEIHVDAARYGGSINRCWWLIRKLRSEVGWETRYSIQETLADMLLSCRAALT